MITTTSETATGERENTYIGDKLSHKKQNTTQIRMIIRETRRNRRYKTRNMPTSILSFRKEF